MLANMNPITHAAHNEKSMPLQSQSLVCSVHDLPSPLFRLMPSIARICSPPSLWAERPHPPCRVPAIRIHANVSLQAVEKRFRHQGIYQLFKPGQPRDGHPDGASHDAAHRPSRSPRRKKGENKRGAQTSPQRTQRRREKKKGPHQHPSQPTHTQSCRPTGRTQPSARDIQPADQVCLAERPVSFAPAAASAALTTPPQAPHCARPTPAQAPRPWGQGAAAGARAARRHRDGGGRWAAAQGVTRGQRRPIAIRASTAS